MEQFSEENIQNFKIAFNLFDKDSNGHIDIKEMGKVLQAIGQNPTEAEIAEMIKEHDVNGNGTLEFEEFCKAISEKDMKSEEEYREEYKEAFKMFDADGNGEISKDELKRILTKIGGSPVSQDDVDAMFESADLNRDGKINIDEFIQTIAGS